MPTNPEDILQLFQSDELSVYVGWWCVLTALSMPSVNSMMKKITAHTDDPGKVAIASG